MNLNPRNRDILNALIKLDDGSFVSREMEAQQKYPWYVPLPEPNAKPDRIKLCPWCNQHLPIAEFIEPGGLLRTLFVSNPNGYDCCVPLANVREWCHGCEGRRNGHSA